MSGGITGRQWLILLSVQLTTILFGLTATSVTVILPQLRGTLSATQDQVSWILTFNLVATAVATPLTGWHAELRDGFHAYIGTLRPRHLA
jgi:DHA2 family multidrug resistance protein